MKNILFKLRESNRGILAKQNTDEWKTLKMLVQDGFAASETFFGDDELFKITPSGSAYLRNSGYIQ